MRRRAAALAALLLSWAVVGAQAAQTPRVSHTSTLLPSGDILIAGGVNQAGTPLATTEILRTKKNTPTSRWVNEDGPTLTNARSSHTATLMANGCVLIAGGVSGVTVRSDARIFNPRTEAIEQNLAITGRFNHTATLLNDGRVLLCGGETATGGAATTPTCDLITPGGNMSATCTGATASLGAVSLLHPRTRHTAVLLKDGKIWFAGGWDGAAYTPTTERYTPAPPAGAGTFSSASPMIEARSNHTSTLMGDGKVLIAGGYNGRNILENLGDLDTLEIYDPVANNTIPGPTLQARRHSHTSDLFADGTVMLYGGLGNITTTYLTNSPIFNKAPGTPPMPPPNDSWINVAGGVITGDAALPPTVAMDFFLSQRVVGMLSDAELRISKSEVILPSGKASINPMVVALGGAPVDTGGNVKIDALNLKAALDAASGTMTFDDLPLDLNGTATGGLLVATPLTPGSNVSFTPTFTMPGGLTGATVTGSITGLVGTITSQSYTTTITDGTITLPGGVVVAADNNVTFSANATSLSGTSAFQSASVVPNATGMTAAGTTYTFPAPVVSGNSAPMAGTVVANMTVQLPLDLANATVTGTIELKAGTITGGTPPTTHSITLTGGFINLAGAAVSPAGVVTLSPATINGAAGTITASGTGDLAASPITNPPAPADAVSGLAGDLAFTTIANIDPTGAAVALAGSLAYNASKVDVSGLTLQVDVSTVVIRSMVYGQAEFYSPKANAVSFDPPAAGMAVSPSDARFGHTATLLPDNDVFLIGGSACANAACSTFASKNSGGLRPDLAIALTPNNFAAKGSLNVPRAFHSSTLLPDGTILVAGGTNGPNVLGTAEVYDPAANTFALTKGAMNEVRDLHTATLLPNGRVLIAGGFSTNAVSTGSTATADIYYPDTKVFIRTDPMALARSNHTATLMPDGNTLVIGGYGANDIITNTVEVYYSTAGVWRNWPQSLGTARALHTATLLNDGRLMVAGGITAGGVTNTVEIYDPITHTWQVKAAMPIAPGLHSHTATLLFDGRVLVAGGNDGFGETNSSYIYDPVGNTWTPNAYPIGQPRFGHTATLLPNNTVMISGGSTKFGAIPVPIEVYRIDISSWVPGLLSFNQGARAFHTMTLAPDGKIYAIGGSDGVIGGGGPTLHAAAEAGYFTADPDFYGKAGPPSARQSDFAITGASPLPPLQWGASFNVTGTNFRGGTEASGGGSASASSSFNVPHMLLQKTDGTGFVVDLTTALFMNASGPSDTSLTATLPALSGTLPVGWYGVRVGANGIYSDAKHVQVGPVKPAAPPTICTGTVMGISSVTWTWDAVASADGYNVYATSSGIFLSTVPARTAAGALIASPFFFQTNLPPNTMTSVAVAGYTISGDGQRIVGSSVPTNAVPSVGSVIGTPGPGSTQIQWGWLHPGTGTTFEVKNATSGEILLPAPVSNSFNDVGLGPNTPRQVDVTPIQNGARGDLSTSATTYTLANPPSKPAVPLTGLTTGSFTLSWLSNGNPAETSYVATIATGAVLVSSRSSSGLVVGIPDLEASTLYTINIYAVNGDGIASTPLLIGSTWTLARTPSDLTVLGTDPQSISVSWDKNLNPDVVTYQVTYSNDNFATNIATAVFFSQNFTGSSTTITGLLTSTTYWIQVTARNPDGRETSGSNQVSTFTYNGGAPQGAIAGVLSALDLSHIRGSLSLSPTPGSRTIDVTSPAGAFPSDVTLTISSYDATNPLTSPLCGNDVNIALELNVSPLLQPLKPIHLTASYTPAQLMGIAPERLALMRYEPVSKTCVPLSTVFDTKSQTFTASLNHFSLYQIARVPMATSAATARIFPNPYRAARDGYVTIDGIPPFSRVRVTTLRGETVFDQKADARGILIWTPSNGAGRTIASGLYLIVVESSGTKKILKLAVIR